MNRRCSKLPTQAVVRPVALVLVILTGGGCMSALQRTLPRAMDAHTRALATEQSEMHLAAPTTFSGLWNAAGLLLTRDHGGVVEEHADSGTMVSDYVYSSPSGSDPTVAQQVRTRVTVVLPPGTTDASRIRATATSERRERRAGAEPSVWTPTASVGFDEAAFINELRDAASGATSVSLAAVNWAAAPSDAARAVARHLTLYSATPGDDSMLQTDWRTTEEQMDDDRLVVRSRLRFLFDPTEGGTRISVLGEMQYRVVLHTAPTDDSAWTDMDAAAVVRHGWATVDEALDPVAQAAREEALETFARAPAAAPDLEDPRGAWGRGGALPPGVARTTTGGSVVIPWRGEESASELLGRAYTAELQPAGQVGLMGEAAAHDASASDTVMWRTEDARQVEVSGGYGPISAHVGMGTNNVMVIYSAYVDTHAYSVPEFADFSNVAPAARYYVAGVSTGRSVYVMFVGDRQTLTTGIAGTYAGFRAGVEASRTTSQVSCHAQGRGVTVSLGCDASHVPTGDEVIAARDAAVSPSEAITHVLLRRIPSAVRPLSAPQSITVTQLTVADSACSDPVGGPDLMITWQTGAPPVGTGPLAMAVPTCPGDRNWCALNIQVPAGSSQITFDAVDDDLLNDDRCGRATFPISQWLVNDIENQPPGPISGRRQQGAMTVDYTILY